MNVNHSAETVLMTRDAIQAHRTEQGTREDSGAVALG